MKTIIRFYLGVMLLLAAGICPAQNLVFPISEGEFQMRCKQISTRPGDEAKLQTIRAFVPGKSFTSQQVKQLAVLFSSDFYRYQMAVEIYPNTLDKDNFYDVYDAFVSYSAVFRLHDYLSSLPVSTVITTTNPLPGTPDITYPLCNNYTGKKGCSLPLADRDFEYYAKNIFNQPNDESRVRAAKDLLSRNCISMAQLMRIALSFDLELNRLGFMKEALRGVYDLENYSYATAVFTNEPYKSDWLEFSKTVVNPVIIVTPPPVVVCEIKADELEQIKATIKKQSFSSTQLSMAKQILNAKKCFTCNQIKQMMQIFSFEESRMEFVKYAWDYTTDKSNYYILADGFSFSSSKEELMSFISSKK
jgi:hypothetical protein